MKTLMEEIENAIDYRPPPFSVSYHGQSTIIVDAFGNWATGQVPRDKAESIATKMNEAIAFPAIERLKAKEGRV